MRVSVPALRTIVVVLAVFALLVGCGDDGGGAATTDSSASSSTESGESTESSDTSGSDDSDTKTEATEDTATTSPDASSACDDAPGFQTGTFTVAGSGSADTITSIALDGDDECVVITMAFNGDAPSLEVSRPLPLNRTTVRPLGVAEATAIADPAIARLSSLLAEVAMVTHSPAGLAMDAIGAPNTAVAASLAIDGDEARLLLRPAGPGDPDAGPPFEGEPTQDEVRGDPDRGLVVTHVGEIEGDGFLHVVGYARAPESQLSVRVLDAVDVEVCNEPVVAQGPPWFFSRFLADCDVPAGTYEVIVGWFGLSGLPEHDVFATFETTIQA